MLLDMQTKGTRYVVNIPTDSFLPYDFLMLTRMIAQNEPVLKRALGAEELPVIHLQNRLWFPWFTLQNIAGEKEVYINLIFRMCEWARWVYIPPEIRHIRRSKLGMRQFLLELGFYGHGQSKGRKFLLRNF